MQAKKMEKQTGQQCHVTRVPDIPFLSLSEGFVAVGGGGGPLL